MSANLRHARGPLGRFFGWWWSELASLLPGAHGGARLRGRWLVLAQGPDGPRLVDEKGTHRRQLTSQGEHPPSELAIAAALEQFADRKRRLPIALRLDSARCYARTLDLPASARPDIARILALDLERSTPFRSRDVLTAHYVLDGKETPPGRIAVRHLVVKRSLVEEASRPLRLAGLAPERIDCWDETGTHALPINFLESDAPPAAAPRTLPRLLALAAVALALVAAVVMVQRHEQALAGLEAQTAAMRTRLAALDAAQRRRDADEGTLVALTRLAAAEVSRALVIDELTRLLPDGDSLTTLKIDGNGIEMQGLSTSAASLVPLLERSQMFSGAALTAPITFDARAGKERFALKAVIREAASRRAGAAGQSGGRG